MVNRPEIREYELELQKLNVDSRLFRNQLLPYLDSKAEIDQSVGQQLYKDKGEFELKLGLEFRVPVQRNEAKGKLQENQAKIQQVALKARFAADKISAETRNALVVLNASHQQIEKTVENAELATWLFDAERSKFELGSTDLLSVQFRERAVLEARLLDIKAREDYFKAIADTLAAVGADFSKIGSIEALGAQFD